MEYAAFVWSPHTANKMESVQRRATCFVMSNYDRYNSVSEMLFLLQWSSLQSRRNALAIIANILQNSVQYGRCLST